MSKSELIQKIAEQRSLGRRVAHNLSGYRTLHGVHGAAGRQGQ
jgi:hypothetical protein